MYTPILREEGGGVSIEQTACIDFTIVGEW